MSDIDRANLVYALAEVVQDSEVITIIESQAGVFESTSELEALEKRIMEKVIAYRINDLWPPKIELITEVMRFDS